MTNRIIVGVDGSETSLAALRWASFEAGRRGAGLLALSCYSVPVYGSPEGAVYPSTDDVDVFKEGASAIVADAMAAAAAIDSTIAVEGVTAMAPATVAISDEAKPGDEIVVGATGHSGVIDGLLGSVAMSVVHRSHVPVIVVPAHSAVAASSSMKKIVVGVDGSAPSLYALEWAYDEALVSGAELTAVHGWVYPYHGERPSASEARTHMQLDAMEELKTSVESLGARLTGGSVHVQTRLTEMSPADALLEESKDADLVVVGSRGRGTVRSTLLGSVSRTIAQHATCPVAVIRHTDS
jgi:nucleotide-binding universal stress UspA family protein